MCGGLVDDDVMNKCSTPLPLSLIKRLINDALFDAGNSCAHFFGHLY